jgi:ABC-type nitrate/sulfonate/bicarbonate transport system substrate-binding protein
MKNPPKTLATTKWLFPVALLTLVVLLAAACSSDASDDSSSELVEKRKIVFMAGFKPQANLPFVAVYVAQENGYFAEQGLEVDIRHASTGEHLKLLLSGDVHFTTAAATSVLKRRSDPGAPIVAIALFGQQGEQAYMALAESGINDLADWEGKTFGYKTSIPPDYLAMVESEGIDRSQVQEVRVGFDPRVLTEGQVDVLAVFKSNEPDTVRRLGFDVKLWDPADFGVPTMGLTYITLSATAETDPDLVIRFLKATMKGFNYALENPKATVDIVLKFAPDENREHQAFMLQTELTDAVSEETERAGLGAMTDAQWKALYDHLIRYEALPQPFDYKTAFTGQFLDEVYDGASLNWP